MRLSLSEEIPTDSGVEATESGFEETDDVSWVWDFALKSTKPTSVVKINFFISFFRLNKKDITIYKFIIEKRVEQIQICVVPAKFS